MPCTRMGSPRMSPTFMRGLSELYGSWKMTCTFCLKGESFLESSFSRLTPSNTISPEVGRSSCRMQRPVVVLPQPDSPTSPKVSPFLMAKLTSSTALTWPTAF